MTTNVATDPQADTTTLGTLGWVAAVFGCALLALGILSAIGSVGAH